MAYSKQLREKACNLYCKNISCREIGDRLCVCHDTVWKWVKKAKIVRHKPRNNKTKEKAVSLYKAGQSAGEIARILPVGLTTIRKWLNQAGIMRSRGNPVDYGKNKWPQEIKEKAVSLCEEGLTATTAAEILKGPTSSTISGWIKNSGFACNRGRQPTGSTNKDDREKISNQKEYKRWRIQVLQRDKFRCVCCGRTGGELHIHHILGFAKYPQYRMEITNGSTLCGECHRFLHFSNKKYA